MYLDFCAMRKHMYNGLYIVFNNLLTINILRKTYGFYCIFEATRPKHPESKLWT